jgi:DNA-binding helix-hairpin-helix protein with protein kinase domain
VIRVSDDRGREYRLGERIDNGAHGVVYEVDRRAEPKLVAKLLLRPGDRVQARRRLASLVRYYRSPRVAPLSATNPPRAAWPITVVTTTDLSVDGYLMPDMRPHFEPFDCMLSAGLRRRHFGDATRATSLAAAASLAELVADLHARGYVVGDMKRENLWVNGHGDVAISDVDSFQFSDASGFFACTSRTPGYASPEVIGAAQPRFDEWSDYFVLAVLIYQLLMDGLHPFYGQPGDGSWYVSLDDNIMHGRARVVSADSVVIGVPAPPLSALPPNLLLLFRRCFDDTGLRDRTSRPTADEWLRQLQAAATPAN